MKRILPLVFVAAVALYLPSINYGFVQDDRAIIVTNPAAHSISAALRGFRDPYWPRESGAGLYRPVTILSYALDWSVSGGRAGWFHFINAIWHGIVTVLLVTILARWLSPIAAAAAGLTAILRAAVLLIWPASLSVDYNRQVLPAQDGISAAAVLGAIVAIGIPALAIWSRRRHRALSFTASLAGLSYLPTANLLFPSGVVLAERNLYLAVALPAGLVATVLLWLDARATRRAAVAAVSIMAGARGRALVRRLPPWRANRSRRLTPLSPHPPPVP